MKFARYLTETQTPEWKRAYIDYRGLKKCIKRAAATAGTVSESSDSHHSLDSVQDRPSIRDIPPSIQEGPSIPEPSHQPEPSSSSSHKRTRSKKSLSRSSHKRYGAIPHKSRSLRRTNPPSAPPSSQQPPSNLQTLLPLLNPEEKRFFDMLEEQLIKVESFYLDREKEARERTKALEMQIEEMQVHRRLFYEAQKGPKDPSSSHFAFWGKRRETPPPLASNVPTLSRVSEEAGRGSSHPESDSEQRRRSLVPDDYQEAKKKLKKAMIEHYRVLEMLHNFRVLNVTGFGKALKKFEKITKIPSQTMFMNEKVNPSIIGSDKGVEEMMSQIHTLFAIHFTKGDRKRAIEMLRPVSQYTSHHFSTFRSGMLIGLGLPALAMGIVNCFRSDVREAIGAWDAVLLVYAILFVPLLLTMLVGLNMVVYAHYRINYVFIFELDPRTRLDYREYFEIPSILFAALCYCFWLSFSTAPSVPAGVWPLVWLCIAFFLLLDPFPFFAKSSRYWLAIAVGRLFLSGTRRVEFTDFWLGDQFTSLVFTLSNLYLIPCVYATTLNFKHHDQRHNGVDWKQHCGSASSNWPAIFVIATLPFTFRMIQSVKRYVDTGLKTHLINGGKYLAGIVAYLVYFLWRHKGGPDERGVIFVLWCTFNAFYSSYALAWDLLMDWSLLQPHAKYWMLRDELVFKEHVPLYYFAIVSNTILRYVWIISSRDLTEIPMEFLSSGKRTSWKCGSVPGLQRGSFALLLR